MIDGGCSPRFVLEALNCCPVAGHLIGKKLEGNFTFEVQVFGTVNHTHAAAAKLLNDAIVRNGVVHHTVKSSATSFIQGISERNGKCQATRYGASQSSAYNSSNPASRVTRGESPGPRPAQGPNAPIFRGRSVKLTIRCIFWSRIRSRKNAASLPRVSKYMYLLS